MYTSTAATTPRAPESVYENAAARRHLRKGQACPDGSHEAVDGRAHEFVWHDAHKKLAWCTERIGRVVDFWVAF